MGHKKTVLTVQELAPEAAIPLSGHTIIPKSCPAYAAIF